MSTVPNLASTPHAAAILTPTTADTSTTAPTNVATAFTAGSSGSQIALVRISQTATTAGTGILNFFLYDGSTYHLWDNYSYSAVTLSTTSEPIPVDIPYAQLVIQAGWSFRVTDTVIPSGNAHFNITVIGGDF